MIVRKRPEDLQKMRRSGLLVWKVLSELEAMVQEGIRTVSYTHLTLPTNREV